MKNYTRSTINKYLIYTFVFKILCERNKYMDRNYTHVMFIVSVYIFFL